MEILTAAEMRRVDERATSAYGIPSLTLMEAAGRGVAEALVREIPGLAGRRVIVLCGKGNNGGDGLVAARHLRELGVRSRVLVLSGAAELANDAALNFARALESGVELEVCEDETALTRRPLELDAETVVVDALLGTGVKGPARGLIARAIDAINASPATIVAVDLPSGADADSGTLPGITVRAHRTLTLCRPKPCLVLEPAASHAGNFEVVDIGIPDEAIAEEAATLHWCDAALASRLMPPRPLDAHKGSLGHVLVVAGSPGKSGAAILAGRAALRSGAGLVTIATPRSIQSIVAAAQAELMTEPLPEARGGGLSRTAAKAVLRLAASRDALVFGPGLGVEPGTRSTVLAVLAGRTVPAVLDADGLNAFAADRRPRARIRGGRHPLVLTPHPGEAARLLGTTAASIQADRLGHARRLAAETGAIVVLKGRRTIVAQPGGTASFNSTGNPGMATAGTGDALSGILGALLARGLSAFDAARLGTYVHGAAGDLAAARIGEDGLIAGDLIDALAEIWGVLSGTRRGVSRWTPGA
jgi:ADP-dependent NAD(P)H-hydrate dehydratase / NAD(P)H-hydrate epimerase